MNRRWHALRIATALAAVSALIGAIPAAALDNPLTVRLTGTKSHLLDASATIFDSGSAVLVDVTRYREILAGSAVTLNAGTCDKPGKVAFTLAPFRKYGSVTQLPHTEDEIYARARSMVVHTSPDPASPAFACGPITG